MSTFNVFYLCRLLRKEDNVELSFENAPKIDHLKGTKKGDIYLTNQRVGSNLSDTKCVCVRLGVKYSLI